VGVRKAWIQVYSGKRYYLLDPKIEDIEIKDIAHALSNICRFSGHTKTFYSVAQHSVIVGDLMVINNPLYGLLHDASEAYLGDITRPLKSLLPDYRLLEEITRNNIYKRFNLKLDLIIKSEVDKYDLIALATEKRDLMGGGRGWRSLLGIRPVKEKINPLSPKDSYTLFMSRYNDWKN